MEAVLDKVFDLLDERLIDAVRYRFGVAHFAAEGWMNHVVEELRRRYDPHEILSGPATAALITRVLGARRHPERACQAPHGKRLVPVRKQPIQRGFHDFLARDLGRAASAPRGRLAFRSHC